MDLDDNVRLPIFRVSLEKVGTVGAVVTQWKDARNGFREVIAEYPDKEEFWVMGLNQRHRPNMFAHISTGTVGETLVHPREVFRPLVVHGASACIFAHCHPSGDAYPSMDDIKVTKQLGEAGGILGIRLLDHLIFGHDEVHSMSDKKTFDFSPKLERISTMKG